MTINSQSFQIKLFLIISLLFCTHSKGLENSSPHLQVRTIAISPYGFIKNAQPQGIYYDLANSLTKDAGYKIDHRIYPYARIIKELKSGKTDLTIMFKYKELEEHVIYIAPLPALKNVVFGRKGTSYKSISDLKGKSIAYLRGAKFSDAIDSDVSIIKYPTIDFEQGINMLALDRVDLIIGPLDPIYAAAKALNRSADLFSEPLVVSERTPWLQISRKSKDRLSVEALSSLFQTLMSQDNFDKLRKQYVSAL